MNFTTIIARHNPRTLGELKALLEQMLASNHPDHDHQFQSDGSGHCAECGFISVETYCGCGHGTIRQHAQVLLQVIKEVEKMADVQDGDFITFVSSDEIAWLTGEKRFSNN